MPEHKTYPKAAPKVEVKPAVQAAVPTYPQPEPKPEPKPVGPKLDDTTLEHCAEIAQSYVSRGTTQHTPRDLLAFEIAAAIRAKKAAK